MTSWLNSYTLNLIADLLADTSFWPGELRYLLSVGSRWTRRIERAGLCTARALIR
jgi:hypothetical protein